MMYDHGGGYDLAPKMYSFLPSHLYKPFSFDWKENDYTGEDDHYRWHVNNDDLGHRAGRQIELIYPNGAPIGYGHIGGKPVYEQGGYMMDAENIPITIMLKGSSIPVYLQHGGGHSGEHFFHSMYNEDRHNHGVIHRVTKPVIQEIHEIVTPYRKANHDIVQIKEDTKIGGTIGALPTGKYSPKQYYDSGLKNYSLMKDKNAHNFGSFNKLYDLGLQMNKVNGYVLNSNHQINQNYSQENSDDSEPGVASSDESSNKTQQA